MGFKPGCRWFAPRAAGAATINRRINHEFLPRRPGHTIKTFTFLVGQGSRSALKSWAAQQRRPAAEVKILVKHPPRPGPDTLG